MGEKRSVARATPFQLKKPRNTVQRRCDDADFSALHAADLSGVARHAQHRSHTYSELTSNAPDPSPLGPRRDDRRYLVRVAILKPPPTELYPVSLGPAPDETVLSLSGSWVGFRQTPSQDLAPAVARWGQAPLVTGLDAVQNGRLVEIGAEGEGFVIPRLKVRNGGRQNDLSKKAVLAC
jgi:hypothetical protein